MAPSQAPSQESEAQQVIASPQRSCRAQEEQLVRWEEAFGTMCEFMQQVDAERPTLGLRHKFPWPMREYIRLCAKREIPDPVSEDRRVKVLRLE